MPTNGANFIAQNHYYSFKYFKVTQTFGIFSRSVKLNTVQPRYAKCTIIMREKKQAAMRYARKKNYAAYLWNVISTLCIQPSFIKIRCFDHNFNSIKSIPLIINRTNYCDLCTNTHSLWWLFDLYLRITVSRCERAIFAVRSPFEMEFLQRERKEIQFLLSNQKSNGRPVANIRPKRWRDVFR